MDMLNREKKIVVFTGDFNINTLNNSYGVHANHFSNLFVSNGYFKLITNATRVTKHSESLIDNIYTNYTIDIDVCSAGTIITDFSEHYSIFMYFDQNISDIQTANNKTTIFQ